MAAIQAYAKNRASTRLSGKGSKINLYFSSCKMHILHSNLDSNSFRAHDHHIMKWMPGTLMWLAALLLPNVVLARRSSFVLITPDKVNMLVGESRPFRLVDQNGQMQTNVSWIISDGGAFQVDEGDELFITARRVGDFRIVARSAGGSAEAAVKVVAGTTLPTGTAKWSAGTIDGCKSTQVVPAVPSASGVDVFQYSECQDGSYVSAYTADGILLGRHNTSGTATNRSII